MAEPIKQLLDSSYASREFPTILLEPHNVQNVRLSTNYDGLFELNIHELPPYHSISQLVAVQDSLTVWKLAIEYYNHNRWQDFDDLCETLKQQYPILGLAQCTTNLTRLLASEQSQTNCKLFFEINARTKEAFNLFSQAAHTETAMKKEIAALLRERTAAQNKTLFIPDQTAGGKVPEPIAPNWTPQKTDRLAFLQQALLDSQSQRGSDDLLAYPTNASNQPTSLSGSFKQSPFSTVKAAPKQALPLANVVFAILQFIRVSQSSTLEVTDTTKLKDRLPPFFTQATPPALHQTALQLESTQMFPMIQIPSTRQAILATVKATLTNIAAQYLEFAPLCYLLLGSVALYEAQYSVAIRFFCLALSKNPLLSPTVRLSIGYCYFYQQRYHDAKIAFSRALNMSRQAQHAPSVQHSDDSMAQYAYIKSLLSDVELQQCVVDSIIAISITEAAILQQEIASANALLDSYIAQEATVTAEQLQELQHSQCQQADIIYLHTKRIFNIFSGMSHYTTQTQHPALTLYVLQLELARRLFEASQQGAEGDKISISTYLKFFKWDPTGTYLNEHLALSTRHRDAMNANANDPNLIKQQCNVDPIITTLQTLTRHNLPQDSNLTPASESTLYPTVLSPQLLTQALFLLAHCYFISHRFDLAEECYSLVLHKLSAAVTTSPNATTASHQAGVAIVESNPLYIDQVSRLRTICLLQIAKCLFLNEKITHACTAINRALSSLPSSFTTFQKNETMYINLEQYLYYQYKSTQGSLYGLGQDIKSLSQDDHNLIKFVGSGGPDGKVLKPYADLEIAVNLTYVQILSTFYSQRKKLYTTTVAAKYSQDENAAQQKAGSKGKKEKLFTTTVPVQQSMPLLSILVASCLYHFEEANKQSRTFNESGKCVGYDSPHLTDQLNYLLLLSINAVTTDLASVQDPNVMLFGLFAIFRLLDVDVQSLYSLLYPTAPSQDDSVYTIAQRLSTDIETSLQSMQLFIYQIIFAVNQQRSVPTPSNQREEQLLQSLSRLAHTHRLSSVSTWTNAATLCSILSLHYQQFNTRMLILQQAQLSQYFSAHKQQIAELEFQNNLHSSTSPTTTTMSDAATYASIYPPPTKIDQINNPFIPLLLPHFPSSLHHILLGSPVSLIPTLTNTQDNLSASGIKAGVNAASAQAMSVYAQSSSLSSSALVATMALPTNNKDKFPFMQHPTYHGLITAVQYHQQQNQSKSPYDWSDISLPTALLCKDNVFTLMMTITSTIAVAMSALEAGPQCKSLVDAVLSTPSHTSAGIVEKYNTTSSDLIQQLVVKLQFADNENCIVPEPSNTKLYNIYGLLLPLPLPVHAVPVLQQLALSMRTFFTSYPFDKYTPSGLTPQGDHFNIYTYSLQHLRNRDFMKLIPQSASTSTPSTDQLLIVPNQTPQQYHFNTYLQHIVSSTSFSLTITGLILSTHGSDLQTRLSRAETFLHLHDLFVNVETIRQKIHATRTITQQSFVSYNNLASKSTNGNLDLLESILSTHHYCTSSRQLIEYQTQHQRPIAADPSSFLHYIDNSTDYMGLAVYFGHYAVSIIKLLQDSTPDRPIMIPLPSLPATYFDDILSASSHTAITSLRSRTQDHYVSKNNLSFTVLPGMFSQLDRSGFDDLSTILTTHAFSSYLELLSPASAFTTATQFTRQVATGQQVINADSSNSGASIYSGHIHPFYMKRFQKQRNLHQNNIVYNSDCILIGRNVGSQIETLIQQTAIGAPRQLTNGAGVVKDVKISLSKALFGSHRLYPKCLYLQLHLSHPHLICSDGSLYSTVTPQLYPDVAYSQLSFISTSWNWHGNQSGLSQEPPLPDDQQGQASKDGKRGEHIPPRDLFPYMYTNLYIHHPTVHQSANSRADSVVKQISAQFGTQLNVSQTSHTVSSLREYVCIVNILLKFKRAEKERVKANRLRESIATKEVSIQGFKRDMAILDAQRHSNPDAMKKYESYRITNLTQEKRIKEMKPDISKAITEYKAISFEILSICNSLILSSQQDAIDFINSSNTAKDAKDKDSASKPTAAGSSVLAQSGGAGASAASKRDPGSEDLNHSSIFVLVLSAIVSNNLLREHLLYTPVKDGDQYRTKLSGVQYNLRQIKALLLKACMSNTSTYQYITALTVYHNTAPLSLVFSPPHLYTPLTANLTTNNPLNPYTSHSNTGLITQSSPISVSLTAVVFQILSMINEHLSNSNDAIYYSFITAALTGLHKTLSTAQHPLWYLGNAAQIYAHDHRSPQLLQNIRNNDKLAQEHGLISSAEHAIQMTSGLAASYPTRTYLPAINTSTYSYFILPSILDCDTIYVNQLCIAMKKAQILPISLLSQLRHSILLQIITQHHLASFLDFSRTTKFTATNPQQTSQQISFTASLLPYGKFDSHGFSSHLQHTANPSLSHGLLSFALQPIIQCSTDYTLTTYNLAVSLSQIAVQCYRFYSFITGLSAAADSTKFNPHFMLFNLRSLLLLQQPEYHAAGSVPVRLTDPIVTELLSTVTPFNQIPSRHFEHTSSFDIAKKADILRDPSKQTSGVSNFLRGTINLSPFDAALTCYVANFCSSAVYSHIREILSALLPNPQPLPNIHNVPPQSLQLSPLYQSYMTAQTSTGMAGNRTISTSNRCDLGVDAANRMFNSVRTFITRETNRQSEESTRRKAQFQKKSEHDARLQQGLALAEAEQARLAQLQELAKQSHAEAMQFAAAKQEYILRVAQPNETRDIDQLPTKEKKKSSRKSSSTSSRAEKRTKKDKKDKTSKRKSRRSSRADDNDELNNMDDFEKLATHFDDSEDEDDDDDDHDHGSDQESSRRNTSRTRGGHDDDDDDNNNNHDDDDDDFLSHLSNRLDGDDDEFREAAAIVVEESTEPRAKTRFDASDDEDTSVSVKKHKKSRTTTGGTAAEQSEVSIGQPAATSTAPAAPVEETATPAKRRLILDSDDE